MRQIFNCRLLQIIGGALRVKKNKRNLFLAASFLSCTMFTKTNQAVFNQKSTVFIYWWYITVDLFESSPRP